jgi:hypothetical protein
MAWMLHASHLEIKVELNRQECVVGSDAGASGRQLRFLFIISSKASNTEMYGR